MDEKDFLCEIHNYIDNSYTEFKHYQDISWEILVEFNKVCKDSKISYYLAYGSLLGAIRDRNQIPWDYDVDVIVPINQRESLISSLERTLGNDFYYAYKNNTKNYPANCLRVCKKGVSYNAIHVDVFFLIGCPPIEEEQNLFYKKCWRNMKLRTGLYFPNYNPSPQNKYLKILRSCKKYLLSSIYTDKQLSRIEEKLINRYKFENSSTLMVLCDVYKRFYPKNIFEEIIYINIRNTELPIPKGFDLFLNITYKNYNEYPLISSRFEEFYTHLSIIKERLSCPEKLNDEQ